MAENTMPVMRCTCNAGGRKCGEICETVRAGLYRCPVHGLLADGMTEPAARAQQRKPQNDAFLPLLVGRDAAEKIKKLESGEQIFENADR